MQQKQYTKQIDRRDLVSGASFPSQHASACLHSSSSGVILINSISNRRGKECREYINKNWRIRIDHGGSCNYRCDSVVTGHMQPTLGVYLAVL
jgi:hypothetical protein